MAPSIHPDRLRSARRDVGLTQQQAANRLGISQAYLALLESGRRPVTPRLAPGIVKLYRLGPIALPLSVSAIGSRDSSSLAAGLAALDYPGFRQLAATKPQNPATLLLAAIASSDVEVRVLEALPWLVISYNDLDWDWLVREAKMRDLQNRLGFIVTLARRLSERRRDGPAVRQLREIEQVLQHARLVRGDTLCQASLSAAERRWLRRARPSEARYWKLLTDLTMEALPYAA